MFNGVQKKGKNMEKNQKIKQKTEFLLNELRPFVTPLLFDEICKISAKIIYDPITNGKSFQRFSKLIYFSDKNLLVKENILNQEEFSKKINILLNELLEFRKTPSD